MIVNCIFHFKLDLQLSKDPGFSIIRFISNWMYRKKILEKLQHILFLKVDDNSINI